MFNPTFKKIIALFCLTAILLLVGSISVLADTQEENIMVGPGEKVKGPSFYGGDIVEIDGTIDGITFAAGRVIRVDGVINGDLVAAAQEIIINGKIMGDLYSAAQKVTIRGQVLEDAIGAAQNLAIAKDAIVGRDFIGAGQSIEIEGTIQRRLHGYAQNTTIDGKIGDNAKIGTENLELRGNTEIAGDLFYESPNEARISGTPKISGKTDWKKTVHQETAPREKNENFFLHLLWGLSSALLIWFLIELWRPSFWSKTRKQILEQPLKTLGIGALTLIVTPIIAIILMITLIGLPLGLLLAILYGIAIYISKIIAAVFIGCWFAQRFSWSKIHRGVWLVLLGLAIIALLTKIPLIGFLIWLLVVFSGLGSVILSYARPEDNSI